MRWLSLSLVAMVLVATIGLGWVFDMVYQQYADTESSESQDEIRHAEVLTKQLAHTLSRSGDSLAFIDAWPGEDGYQLSMISLSELILPESLLQLLQAGEPLNLESDSDISIHYLVPDSEQVLVLHLPVSDNQNNHLTGRYGFTSLFYLLLIALFLLWARPLVDRLLQLRKTARAFGKGELSQRISVGKVSYISDLEVEFNHMAQRIEDLVSDVKLLSSAVSHDLRTPLARIRMGLDTLSEESDPDKRQQYEERINEHIDDMVELIETLLSYARFDQAMLQLEKREVKFNELVAKLVARKQQPGKTLTLHCSETSGSFLVYGDSTYLKMLVTNLLQNALQHASEQVQVHLERDNDNIILRIKDDGAGIPEELISDIFKPFVRSRNSKYKGHGVGLAICKRVVDWHQGNIRVQSGTALKGAEFVVSLPLLGK